MHLKIFIGNVARIPKIICLFSAAFKGKHR
jgi:hypothetical protein